jgi:hypothetical protein
VDVEIHVILTSALVGGEWPASCPCWFTPGTHWIGGWVDPKAGLDDKLKQTPWPLVRKRTILTATITCWRNLVRTFVDRGVSRGQHSGSPMVINLRFLDRSRYFFLQVAPYLSSQGLGGPRSRPTATQKIW